MSSEDRARRRLQRLLAATLGEEAATALVDEVWRRDPGDFETRMLARFDQIDARFNDVDRRFDAVDDRLDGIDRRLDEVDRRFEQVDRRFEQVDHRFALMEHRSEAMEHRLRASFLEEMNRQTRLLFFGMVGAIFTSASLAFASVRF